MAVQGLGGIMSITGHEGSPPTRVGTSIGDIGAGLYTTVAVNAALFHRERTGEATKVDVAMFDCQLALLENAIMRYTVPDEMPGPLGARHPSITPFEAFPTAKTATSSSRPATMTLWLKLCEGLGRPDLAADPRLPDQRSPQPQPRRAAARAGEGILTGSTDGRMNSRSSRRPGMPCGPINNVEQALHHPQVAARNMLVTMTIPRSGACRSPATRSNFRPSPIRRPAIPRPISTATVPRSCASSGSDRGAQASAA